MSVNRKIAAVLVTASILAGIGTGVLIDRLDSGTAEAAPPKTQQTTEPTETPEPAESEETPAPAPADSDPTGAPKTLGNVLVRAGGVGPITTGTPVQEGIDAGWLMVDDERTARCGSTFYRWADPVAYDGLDLIVGANGTVDSIGVHSDRYRTRAGQGIGTTYGELKTMFGGDLSAVSYNDFDVPFVTYNDERGWVAFGLEGEAANDQVNMMEVSQVKPTLLRDGC